MTSLDIDEGQILIDYFDDPNGLVWHHRVLLLKREGGSWVVATPDLEVEQADLGLHRVRSLRRVAPLPSQYAGTVYLFDEPTDGELRTLRAGGAALADVLGFELRAAVVGGSGKGLSWRLSNASLASFAESVPDGVAADPENMVIRGEVGLILVDGRWTTAERVEDSRLEVWKANKVPGLNRDARFAGDDVTPTGCQVLGFREGIARYRDLPVPRATSSAGVHDVDVRGRHELHTAPHELAGEERSGGAKFRVPGPQVGLRRAAPLPKLRPAGHVGVGWSGAVSCMCGRERRGETRRPRTSSVWTWCWRRWWTKQEPSRRGRRSSRRRRRRSSRECGSGVRREPRRQRPKKSGAGGAGPSA